MKLEKAFDLNRGDVVSFIGAGGKTSLLVSLGYELAEAGWRVLATTTTHLTEEQVGFFPGALTADADASLISQALNERQFVLLFDEIRAGRVYGPSLQWTKQLLDRVDSDILLVEADDARNLPFKAPRPGEPRIPAETSLVVSVASLSALGKPLNADHIYNPGAMIDKYGFAENSPVKSPWLAQVLRDEELGMRGIPDDSRVLVYLNQTPERGYMRGRARLIARLSLQSKRISAVALGSARGAEPVHEVQRPLGALVLAAADAHSAGPAAVLRRGERGRAALALVTEKVFRSRIDHVRVITGRGASAARQAIQHLGATVEHNPAWKTGGFVSALRTGLQSLPEHVAAVLVLPGDQAQLQPKTIHQLMTLYARGEGEFLIPRYRGRSGHPVLIGQRHWPDILKMPSHFGFSAIAERFATSITYLDVDSDCVLRKGESPNARRLLSLTGSVRFRGR
ncbi:MAG: putative selenium-dependent hydroxylase accessory protein YqeC [Chloroflexi bacterium]|nr:putative selenium-dependent hydroxylase accessory protein YqeC [Chloroflexota bacterium]